MEECIKRAIIAYLCKKCKQTAFYLHKIVKRLAYIKNNV